MEKINQLYILSDDFLTPKHKLIFMMEEVLKNGVKIIQLRDKISSDDELLEYAIKLQNLCLAYKATLVINDRINLAVKINANAIHVGKDDEKLSIARKLLPNAIIGVSCYNDINLALKAQEEGASYVAFGAFFKTDTKKNTTNANLDILKKAKEKIKIPICAIGGINTSNINQIANFKPNLISLVSAAYKPFDIATNIKNLRNAIN